MLKQGLVLQQSQKLELKQNMKLTQQLQQAIKVLQVPYSQLEQMIEQEVMENPVLEYSSSSDEEGEEEQEFRQNSEQQQLLYYVQDFEKYFHESQDSYFSDFAQSSVVEEGSFEEFVPQSQRLSDVLEEQLNLSIHHEWERKVGRRIIASLNEHGYLGESVEKIAEDLKVNLNEAEKVLTLVQSFEPVGIAARDLRECLLIQYHSRELEDPLMLLLIDEYLEDLGNNRMKEIHKETGASFKEISDALERIRSLNPCPASGYLHEVSTAEIIKPDVFVKYENGKLELSLNDQYLPNIRVNNYYQEKIQTAKGLSKDELVWLKKKLESALWFRQCLEKRNETILGVARAIFQIQIDFFECGVKGLKPLKLADVAEIVERHEATVARTVNGKYAHTPAGVFELKFFFSGGLKSEDGEMVTSRRIKEIIEQAIAEENSRKPLSDQILCDLLNARGIDIARRTVAKYRESLGIPSSSKRKKYV